MTSRQFALSDLCEIVSSKRVFAADYKDEGIPFYRGKEVSQLARGESVKAELFISEAVYEDAVSRTGKISAGDVLMTAVGTLGNVYRVKEDDQEFYFKDGNVVWLRNFRPFVNSSFLRHWLGSPLGRKKVLNTAIGSTQAALTIAGLSQIQIQLPSLAKQQEIAELLDTTDSLIRLNQGTASNLEQIAQTIFKSWFIDFDPVNAKSRGEQPEGMDAETAVLFPDSFEESELGLIPSGWTCSTVGQSFSLTMGQSPPGNAYNELGEGLPFFQGRTDFGQRFPALRMFSTEGKRVAASGDTLVSVRAPVGDLNQALEPCILGRGLAALRHKSDSESYTYCMARALQTQLEYFNGEGTVFGAINKKDFEALKCIEPSEHLVTKFDDVTGAINQQIRLLHEQSVLLKNLLDALLPRLISGDLEIPEELLVD